MFYISHRGNLNGKITEKENSPDYILEALNKGYDVEIDIWYINNKWYFGHDEPKYEIKSLLDFNEKCDYKLWLHCKNLESLYILSNYPNFEYFKFFWHQNDSYTLTSNKYIWTFPGEKLTDKCICVLPETVNYSKNEIFKCSGICSDYIENYK